MREGYPSTIIGIGMVLARRSFGQPHRPAKTVLAICGDPVVGRALTLLLQSSLYEVRFLPVSALSEPGALEGVRLVLLAPTWELDAGRRGDLRALVRDASAAAG